jgi:hypothetical protein
LIAWMGPPFASKTPVKCHICSVLFSSNSLFIVPCASPTGPGIHFDNEFAQRCSNLCSKACKDHADLAIGG